MGKTERHVLQSRIRGELITYLGAGALNQDQLVQSIDYAGQQIAELERLKKLHFVLYSDVVDYIKTLPEYLRRLKTVTQQEDRVARGEIRGRINWGQTIQQRAAVGYDDPTLFVVSSPTVEYDIPENRVVKKLLASIADPLTNDIEAIEQDWRGMWNDQDIVSLQQILARNIYLDALPEPEAITLSKRDLETARRSRHRLYTESHRLYRLYEDLMEDRLEQPAVQDLLAETLVIPAPDHTLFELYCVFGVVQRLRNQYPELKLQPIESGSKPLASLRSDEQRLEVYYDRTGPLTFFEDYPDSSNLTSPDIPESIRRHAVALEAQSEAATDFLSRNTREGFFSGRPDFLVLQYMNPDESSNELEEALIGEVKYTRSPQTFSTGLRELFEYLYLARIEDTFLYDDDASSPQVSGLLCTDGVETETKKSGMIQHITTEDFF